MLLRKGCVTEKLGQETNKPKQVVNIDVQCEHNFISVLIKGTNTH